MNKVWGNGKNRRNIRAWETGSRNGRAFLSVRAKRAAALACCALVTAGLFPGETALASPEFAYSSEKWASLRDDILEYTELADLIHEYNSQVINNRLEYDDYRDKTNDDMRNTYSDMADRLEDSSDRMLDGIDEDQPGYGAAEAAAMSARLQAEQARDQADMENEDGRVKKYEYDRQEALLVKEAQTHMIDYWKKEKALPALEEALRQAEIREQAARERASLGMLSQPELLEAQAASGTARAAIVSARKEKEDLRRQLVVMTGWDYDALPKIQEINLPEENAGEEIDLTADREKAIERNYSLAADSRRLENTDPGTARDVLEQKVEAGREQIRADVEAKYKSLLQARADYRQAEEEYRLSEEKAGSDRRRYELGLLAANALGEAQEELAAKKTAYETAGLNWKQACEDYQWAVNGLGAYGV